MFNNNNNQQQRIFQDPEDTNIFEEINGIYLSDLEKDFILNYDIVDLNMKFLKDFKLFFNKLQYYEEDIKENLLELKENEKLYSPKEYKLRYANLKLEQFGAIEDIFLSLDELLTNLIVQKIQQEQEPKEIILLGNEKTTEVIDYINNFITTFEKDFESNRILQSDENLFLTMCHVLIDMVKHDLGLGYELYLTQIMFNHIN